MKQFVLGYVTWEGGILLLERTVPGHPQFGYWNGVGGHVERGECWHAAMERELREETGLAGKCTYRGSVMFSNGHFMHMFHITEPTGFINRHCDEGTLHMVSLEDVFDVPLYSGQEVWLPMILESGPEFAIRAEWGADNRLVSYEVLQ